MLKPFTSEQQSHHSQLNYCSLMSRMSYVSTGNKALNHDVLSCHVHATLSIINVCFWRCFWFFFSFQIFFTHKGILKTKIKAIIIIILILLFAFIFTVQRGVWENGGKHARNVPHHTQQTGNCGLVVWVLDLCAPTHPHFSVFYKYIAWFSLTRVHSETHYS